MEEAGVLERWERILRAEAVGCDEASYSKRTVKALVVSQPKLIRVVNMPPRITERDRTETGSLRIFCYYPFSCFGM